jgi:hypothetical protein
MISLKKELECDSLIGIKYFQDGTPSVVSPIIKDAKDFMKAKETRDALQVLFVPNFEALRTVLGDKPLSNDFD